MEISTQPHGVILARRDPLRVALAASVFVLLYAVLYSFVFGPILFWLGALLAGAVSSILLATLLATWLSLRIFEGAPIASIGLAWNRASVENLGLGIGGGMGAACLVLAPPLLFGAARLTATPDSASPGSFVFVTVLLAGGAAGEEMLFRGYAFQILLARFGAFATILPVSIVFALLHYGNPNATWFGLFNTAGFGVLFGYAFLRTRDLWLPIGLHFGWNFALPLFGVNLSGFKMRVTGHQIVWMAGNLWSGGEYGPEASVLTSLVLIVLFVYVWKAPLRRQHSPLTDPPAEDVPCEPSPRLPS